MKPGRLALTSVAWTSAAVITWPPGAAPVGSTANGKVPSGTAPRLMTDTSVMTVLPIEPDVGSSPTVALHVDRRPLVAVANVVKLPPVSPVTKLGTNLPNVPSGLSSKSRDIAPTAAPIGSVLIVVPVNVRLVLVVPDSWTEPPAE